MPAVVKSVFIKLSLAVFAKNITPRRVPIQSEQSRPVITLRCVCLNSQSLFNLVHNGYEVANGYFCFRCMADRRRHPAAAKSLVLKARENCASEMVVSCK